MTGYKKRWSTRFRKNLTVLIHRGIKFFPIHRHAWRSQEIAFYPQLV